MIPNTTNTTLSLPTVSMADILRHHIGMDFKTFAGTTAQQSNFPPYNIVQMGEDGYAIVMAVAGFSKRDISVTLHNGELTVTGEQQNAENRFLESDGQPSAVRVLHKGLALRDFDRSFRLAEHIVVRDITLRDGLLQIYLEREVPEAAKPRLLTISD